jgi:hypothetical protein
VGSADPLVEGAGSSERDDGKVAKEGEEKARERSGNERICITSVKSDQRWGEGSDHLQILAYLQSARRSHRHQPLSSSTRIHRTLQRRHLGLHLGIHPSLLFRVAVEAELIIGGDRFRFRARSGGEDARSVSVDERVEASRLQRGKQRDGQSEEPGGIQAERKRYKRRTESRVTGSSESVPLSVSPTKRAVEPSVR